MKKILIFLCILFSYLNLYALTNENLDQFDEPAIVVLNSQNEQLNREIESIDLSGLGITATSTEINQVCDGVGASVTASNLTTLTNGSNADSLHTHKNDTWDYDSLWFTANAGTLYPKAHSISMSFPTDTLEIYIVWRSSSGSSYIVPVANYFDIYDGHGPCTSYNGTNIYVKTFEADPATWTHYVDSSGTKLVAGNGELRLLARKQTT